jgi:hypothetical protein
MHPTTARTHDSGSGSSLVEVEVEVVIETPAREIDSAPSG